MNETHHFLWNVGLYRVSGSSAVEFFKVRNTPYRPEPRHCSEALRQSCQRGFSTPQNLTVTASFASNGSLCRAVIKSDVESGITDLQLHTVLEELAPPAVLGKFKIATFLDIICMKLRKAESATSDSTGKTATELAVDACGECSGASEEYERAYVTRYGNTNQYSSVHITFRQPECEGLNTVHP